MPLVPEASIGGCGVFNQRSTPATISPAPLHVIIGKVRTARIFRVKRAAGADNGLE